ncbi:MAG: hypothetical protein LCH61_07105 [Proteobacteria bacterium]|nr:hypothetical protein [Pseudomonadota bacterium]
MSSPLLAHADLLRSGRATFTGWVSVASAVNAEILAREDFDSITLDMQHGLHDQQSVIDGIAYAALAGKATIVRIQVGDFSFASRALDYGAMGIIAPMINSVEDAKKFAAYTKFPPLGERSFGPVRAATMCGMTGGEYLKIANRATVAIAMIETQQAIDALDDILAVDGIDGVFVGPSDLSISLFNGAKVDQAAPEVFKALKHVVARAKAHGKFATAFCLSGASAAEHAALGYSMMTTFNDINMLQLGARAELQLARAGAVGKQGGNAY